MSHVLRVMSFNLRYAGADDHGERSWRSRRDLVARTIKNFDPDLLSTQEGLAAQLQDLLNRLSNYTLVGAGREDGRQAGEQVAIFLRSARFRQIRSGHFWLSETPEIPGSTSWDSRLPRMVTWVEAEDQRASGHGVRVANTHFDHRSSAARLAGAQLIRKYLRSWGNDAATVVTGDFNCGEGKAPYQILVGKQEASDPFDLIDAYRVAHPETVEREGTRHDFGERSDGDRIDWILHSPHLRTVEAAIDRSIYDGQFPSDHYPVTAVLDYAPLVSDTQM